MMTRALWVAVIAVMLSACASKGPMRDERPVSSSRPLPDRAGAHSSALPRPACVAPMEHDESQYTAGGLYRPGVADSAAPVSIDPAAFVEASPREEPRAATGNRSPYTVLGRSYRVMDSAEGYVERGVASWYGYKFHGRHTSSRELYDMCSFSAAHKTLPLPSWVRVTNLDNGRSVVVRVNDRGPFHEGRIIDLSYAAAHRLDMKQAGTARVEVRALSRDELRSGLLVNTLPDDGNTAPEALPPEPLRDAPPPVRTVTLPPATPAAVVAAPLPSEARRGVQVGAFGDRRNAERVLQQLANAGLIGAAVVETLAGDRAIWRVRFAPMAEAAAQSLRARIIASGIADAQLFSESPLP